MDPVSSGLVCLSMKGLLRFSFLAVLALPVVASAVPNLYYTARNAYYFIDAGAAANFSGATGSLEDVVQAEAEAENSIKVKTLDLPTLATGLNDVSTGGATVFLSPIAGNLWNWTTLFDDPSQLTGTAGYKYNVTASSNPLASDDSFMQWGVSAGHESLLFGSRGGDWPDQGGLYQIQVDIAGDWSGVGTGAGQHLLLSSDPNWFITSDFVYDSLNNVTTFNAINLSYDGSSNPGVQFRLYGAAVPEPGSMAVVALGVGALLRRRRK